MQVLHPQFCVGGIRREVRRKALDEKLGDGARLGKDDLFALFVRKDEDGRGADLSLCVDTKQCGVED